ncbi:MAG TPA: peptidoglycan-binding domain-containing protein [Stellaceae bacterium]|nr:peptidoglycan-binding domain-containing protein [Stellaceae bacterium]
MKQSMTAIAAIIAAAGFAGAAQAQSMTPPGTSPSQTLQSTQYTGQNPSQPYGAQYNPYAAQQQSAPGTANWNQAPQNGPQQRQAMVPQSGMPESAGGQTSRDAVRQAQEQLREQGLYRGADDGVIGSGTRRALARFQRRNGLRVTGSLDEQTLSRLSGSSPQGYGATAGQAAAPMQPTGNPATSQAPTTGAYSPNAANSYPAGGYNPQGNPPTQR